MRIHLLGEKELKRGPIEDRLWRRNNLHNVETSNHLTEE